jgi:hypothetical protein
MVNTLRVLPINLEYVLDVLTIFVNNGLIYIGECHIPPLLTAENRRSPYSSCPLPLISVTPYNLHQKD